MSEVHQAQQRQQQSDVATNVVTASETAICDSIQQDLDLRIPYYCEENVWRLAYRKLYYQRRKIKQQQQQHPAVTTPISNETNEATSSRHDDNNNIHLHNTEIYYVVFISNPQKCVPMYYQRAAAVTVSSFSEDKNEKPCCYWDYHVILIGVTPTRDNATNSNDGMSDSKRILVYDIDTTITPYPLPLNEYLSLSFPLNNYLSDVKNAQYFQYKPCFRIIPAKQYVQHFSSDRSHMYNETAQSYNEPPPPYSCIIATSSSRLLSDSTTTVPNMNKEVCNFQKYIDFTTIHTGDKISENSPASPFGTIVTLEQLMRQEF